MNNTNDKEIEAFFNKINSYSKLSDESIQLWTDLLKKSTYKRKQRLISVGQVPKKIAFVVKGLFSQYYITESGDTVIKHFFCENRFAGSVPATLTKSESKFTIEALEESTVLEYDFLEFKKLVGDRQDVAKFYINYMEQHWVIEKEPIEIGLRTDTAAKRYGEFVEQFPTLVKRIKKHQIASYLGITPTQLSRILLINK